MTKLFAPVLLAVLAISCSQQSSPRPASASFAVTAPAAGVTRVTVEVQPANILEELVLDASAGKFVGTLSVPAGAQTFVVRAYAGDTLVGTGSASATVRSGEVITVGITVVDSREPADPPLAGPAVSSLVAPAFVDRGGTTYLQATGVDPDGGTLTWAWTQACTPSATGTFATPAAATTGWMAPSTTTTCQLTVTVTSSATGLSASKSATVGVIAGTGGVDVIVDVKLQPVIDEVRLDADATPGLAVCSISRTAASATCPDALVAGGGYTVAYAFHPGASADASAVLTDDCGGTTMATAAPGTGQSAGSFHWIAPATARACRLTVQLTSDGLTDAFPVAFVVSQPPAPGAWSVTPLGMTNPTDVWGFSANDVWIVGGTEARHWDGSTWTSTTTGSNLVAIWGAAPDDVWAVGTSVANGVGTILHWDGTTWSEQATSAGKFRGIWGSAANDVWLVGTALLHWDGSSWTQFPIPTVYFWRPEEVVFEGVWGRGPDDVWAVGITVLHWNGSAWSEIDHGTLTLRLTGVWGAGPEDDPWAVGSAWPVGGPVNIRWNGTEFYGGHPIGGFEPSGFDQLDGVWGSSPTDVWAVGKLGVFSGVAHWDGTSWSAIPVGEAGLHLDEVWVGAPGDVWAVGVYEGPQPVGVLVRRTP